MKSKSVFLTVEERSQYITERLMKSLGRDLESSEKKFVEWLCNYDYTVYEQIIDWLDEIVVPTITGVVDELLAHNKRHFEVWAKERKYEESYDVIAVQHYFAGTSYDDLMYLVERGCNDADIADYARRLSAWHDEVMDGF